MSKQPVPRKKSVAYLCKQIDACKNRIAAERDKLRELIGEVQEIAYDCDEAVNDLERAADGLSKYL